MFAIVESISSIYHYQTNRKSWRNPGYASVYCLSYQLAGHYDHKFDSGVLEVKKDTLFLITKHTPYSVLRKEHGEAICVTFSAQMDLPASVYDCATHPEIKIMFQKLLSYKNLKSKMKSRSYMKICNSCNKQIIADWNYCKYCGSKQYKKDNYKKTLSYIK